MKTFFTITFLSLAFIAWPLYSPAQEKGSLISFDFYGDRFEASYDPVSFVDFNSQLSSESIQQFYSAISQSDFTRVISAMLEYKDLHSPDDWLYYQLVRKVSQAISPKTENYERYTLYKWYFLCKSGYDAMLAISDDKILFYVQSDENIYNIPYRVRDGKQYVCLNYHDYGEIDFEKNHFTEIAISHPEAYRAFSYKVTHLPVFDPEDYVEKDIVFNYYHSEYEFKIKLNPQVKTLFANYPVVDYESYFNIPLSRETYNSLIPSLWKNIKNMTVKNGVDYLMRFTRYAFLFKSDIENFGQEKRLSPEQTLLYENSDCEDRAALFFYLVKEIYDLPMIVLAYPKHVTIAVGFNKPVGKTVLYKGTRYSICEPTPQREDLALGEPLPDLRKIRYQIVYSYHPGVK